MLFLLSILCILSEWISHHFINFFLKIVFFFFIIILWNIIYSLIIHHFFLCKHFHYRTYLTYLLSVCWKSFFIFRLFIIFRIKFAKTKLFKILIQNRNTCTLHNWMLLLFIKVFRTFLSLMKVFIYDSLKKSYVHFR